MIIFQTASVPASPIVRGRTSYAPQADPDIISVATASGGRKRPPEELIDRSPCDSTLSTATSSSGFAPMFSSGSNVNMSGSIRGRFKEQKQIHLSSNPIDLKAPVKLDIALCNLVHCRGLDFNLPEDPLVARIIEIARTLPMGKYTPPGRNRVGGDILDTTSNTAMKENLDKVVDEGDVFGITGYGDLATIQKYAMCNFLAAGANNPFAVLDFIDCSAQCADGAKKDAEYLAKKFIPIIRILEQQQKSNGRGTPGIVDVLIFDGATNVQKAGAIMCARFPRMTCIHGSEHVMGLVFKDTFTKCPEFVQLSNVCKKFRNVFGSARHAPTAMFRMRAKEHNGGRKIGFIKISEVR